MAAIVRRPPFPSPSRGIEWAVVLGTPEPTGYPRAQCGIGPCASGTGADRLPFVGFETLARLLVGSTTGIVLQYLTDQDRSRSQRDLDTISAMLIRLAGIGADPNRG